MNDHDPADSDARARRRLKGFALHLMIYFTAIAIAAALNHVKTPDQLWFIYPMIAWGAPLALHAAWVMGLFDGLTRRN
jgi:hypothetical protein